MASNQTTLPNVSENEETLLTGVNENVYEDQSIGAELTKKDINRVAWRSMLLQASFNYERMQASGWLYGLLPALKKIHTNKRDLARAMKGHMGFFNTHPFLVTFVIGIILAMERSKQDVNSIQSTKIAVGAPLGGIGDAMFWLTLLPGIKAKDEHIAKMIAEGKVAFGLSVEHVEHAIPMLINHLK